jgi:hypothetical protein
MNKLVFYLLILFLCTSPQVYAQEIELNRVFSKEGQVHFNYNLHDQEANKKYQLRLYGSQDNFISPLNFVKGDVGLEVSPGQNKEIIWNATEALGADFDGKMSFELRARVYVPFVSLNDFNEYKVMKRSQDYEVTWTGGRSTNVLTIDLYKGEQKMVSYPNIANAGHYTMEIPKSLKPGKDYRMKISDKNNKDEVVYSDLFELKRRIPLVLQGVSGVFVAAGVYFLITQTQSPVNGETGRNLIPSPPDAPQD